MQSFEEFCGEFFDKYFSLHPTEGIHYGIEGYDHLLNDFGDEAYEEEKAKRYKEVTAAITEALSHYTAIGRKLETRQALEETYNQVQQTRKKYAALRIEETDRLEQKKNVEVQVRDRPQVGWAPYSTTRNKQVAAGVLGGLGIGLFLALLIEILKGKVRFKSDVESEFRVPVIGIIPRR